MPEPPQGYSFLLRSPHLKMAHRHPICYPKTHLLNGLLDMNVNITEFSQQKSAIIAFDKDLPSFPSSKNQRWLIGNDGMIFNRHYSIEHVAFAMVRENEGILPIEFSNCPFTVFYEFLSELVVIPGFIGIRRSDRYSLDTCIGHLFDATAVGQEIAELVRNHFYPQQALNISSDGNHS